MSAYKINMSKELELYNSIKSETDQIFIFDKVGEAKESINAIAVLIEKENYRQKNPEILKKYEALIVQLRWIALPLLNKADVLDLFNRYFTEILKIEYFDLDEKARSFLIGAAMHEERDTIKSELRSALSKNDNMITSKKLINNMPPTIENWLKIYISSLGAGIVDNMKLRQFYIDNKDFNALTEEEKNKIETLYKFYEKLKFSSLTVAGVEENIPVVTSNFKGYIRKGQLEKDAPMDKKMEKIFKIVANILGRENINQNYSKSLQQLASQYQEGSLERRAIEEEIKKQGGNV